jgi:DNA-binding NarL/FixJ family response regulator
MSGGTGRVLQRHPLRVALASDQTLVAETVAAALRHRSFEPLLIRWPPPNAGATGTRRRRPFRRTVGPPPEVGLLVSELRRMAQVEAAVRIVTGVPVPWLVLAGMARGPAWGALYDAGAELVVPSDTRLVEVVARLLDLAAGRKPYAPRGRRELIEGWRRLSAQRRDLTVRLQTLTEREDEILRQLHRGQAVRSIADQSEVTEATVRSQVKAILRKLDVNSQMAAVAAYEDVLTDATVSALIHPDPDPDPDPPAPERHSGGAAPPDDAGVARFSDASRA